MSRAFWYVRTCSYTREFLHSMYRCAFSQIEHVSCKHKTQHFLSSARARVCVPMISSMCAFIPSNKVCPICVQMHIRPMWSLHPARTWRWKSFEACVYQCACADTNVCACICTYVCIPGNAKYFLLRHCVSWPSMLYVYILDIVCLGLECCVSMFQALYFLVLNVVCLCFTHNVSPWRKTWKWHSPARQQGDLVPQPKRLV